MSQYIYIYIQSIIFVNNPEYQQYISKLKLLFINKSTNNKII
jgi:hypothetical protein